MTVPSNLLDGLDDRQHRLLSEFEALLVEFNQRINLISREDEAHIALHHIAHCLYLTHRCFPSGSTVVDWGTGGGLPAIPLAIAQPDVHVVAVDAVRKKVQAVRAMARRLGLENIEALHVRAEEVSFVAAYSVSRATAPLKDLWQWHLGLATPPPIRQEDGCWRPGLICLKGGDLEAEIAAVKTTAVVERIDLSELDPHAYFEGKVLLSCTARG